MWGAVTAGGARAQVAQDKLTGAGLSPLLTGLGYEPKALNSEAGKEKWEVSIKGEKFNIPLAFEISPSGRYLWLTVNLGAEKPSIKYQELLKSNASIQPCQFYITTKGFLMMAIALENRSLKPADVKWGMEKIQADVENTSTLWNQ